MTSHAGYRYGDLVRCYRIQLRYVSIRQSYAVTPLGYAAVRAFRQFDQLTYSLHKRKARTAAAKECGGILYVAEFYIDALYHGNENRQR